MPSHVYTQHSYNAILSVSKMYKTNLSYITHRQSILIVAKHLITKQSVLLVDDVSFSGARNLASLVLLQDVTAARNAFQFADVFDDRVVGLTLHERVLID